MKQLTFWIMLIVLLSAGGCASFYQPADPKQFKESVIAAPGISQEELHKRTLVWLHDLTPLQTNINYENSSAGLIIIKSSVFVRFDQLASDSVLYTLNIETKDNKARIVAKQFYFAESLAEVKYQYQLEAVYNRLDELMLDYKKAITGTDQLVTTDW